MNPLTYEVQGLRQMLVGVGGSGEVWLGPVRLNGCAFRPAASLAGFRLFDTPGGGFANREMTAVHAEEN